MVGLREDYFSALATKEGDYEMCFLNGATHLMEKLANQNIVKDTRYVLAYKGTRVARTGREGGREGGVLDRKDVLDLMHGRSRITVDPRIPTMPRRSMSGFHRPGRHCLHQARSAMRCLASRMKGGLYPTKNRF